LPKDYVFRIYALDDDKSNELLAGLKSILASKLKDNYEIEVINPLSDINHAEAESVFILPTLVKVSPPPSMRVIGDLSDKDKVLAALGIR